MSNRKNMKHWCKNFIVYMVLVNNNNDSFNKLALSSDVYSYYKINSLA